MAILNKESESFRPELEFVVKRNKFMESLRKGKQQLYRKRSLIHFLIVRGLSWAAIAKTRLLGRKNMDFINAKLGEEQVTIAAGHTSDIDHPALDYTLIENGYPKLADHLVFPAGLKMWDRPQIEWGVPSMNTFPIAPPGYFEEAQAMIQTPLTEKERQLLIDYQKNMEWLNRASLKALLRVWQSGQAMVVVYPETTRSRDGLLKRGREETNIYFKRGWVLPLLIQGVGEVFPPDKSPVWEKIVRREFEVTIAAGEPIDTRKLWHPKTLGWLEEREANPVDFVMSRIAVLNPNCIDPRYRPLYESLWSGVPEGLVVQ